MKTVKAPKARQLPSGQWFCRVRIDGKDIPITRDTRDAAERDALAVKMGILQAKQNVNLTLSEAIDQYIEDRANLLSPATIRGYRTIQKNRLQTIMNRPVSKLNTQSVQRAINADAADVSAKTLKNTIGLLSAVLNCHNIELGRLTLPEPPKKQKQIYTKEQLGKLLEAVTGADIEIPVLLAAWLGLRRSEIAGLRWDAIDFDAGTLEVKEAIVPDEHHKMVSKGTKTADSARVLDCPAYILDVLRRQDRTSEYVYTQHPETTRRHLQKACEQANIPCIGLHALRHTNASVMLRLGVPDKYAMERGGWSENGVMKSVYQHTMDDKREEVTKTIDSYFEAIVPTRKKTGPKKYRLTKGGLPKSK